MAQNDTLSWDLDDCVDLQIQHARSWTQEVYNNTIDRYSNGKNIRKNLFAQDFVPMTTVILISLRI